MRQRETEQARRGLSSKPPDYHPSLSYPLISLLERLKYSNLINYNTCPRRDNFVHLLVGATDGHAVFTTSLHLNASFVMVPRALHPELDRVKSAPGFEAQIGQTFSHAAARRD